MENNFNNIDLDKVKMLAELGHTDAFLAKFFGVSLEVWNKWKKAYPSFFIALENWKDHADKRVERSMYESAIGYEHEEEKIFCSKEGLITRVKTRKKYPPDVKAAIFWLKNRKPSEWKDKTEVDAGADNLAAAILKARARIGIKELEDNKDEPEAPMEFLE